MKKVVLLRHGESVWNKENRFTGWTDVDLSEKGVEEARKAGRLLKEQGFKFDMTYTSYLKRAIKTANTVLEEMEQMWLPVERTWRLNEKHYGMLQGLNKAETAAQYGDEQVKIWRRSYDIAPNPQDANAPESTWNDPRYVNVPREELPLTESLKDTVERAIPYWQNVIVPSLLGKDAGCCSCGAKAQNEILIAAHGNSLRAIIKYLKNISDSDIVALNLPTAVPYLFVFDDNMNLVKDEFLGDPEEIKALMEAVANQGKSK